jgi:hypothetical protein
LHAIVAFSVSGLYGTHCYQTDDLAPSGILAIERCSSLSSADGSLDASLVSCVAMYFAWLGFYTQWLIAPALLGVIVVLIGVGITNEAQVPPHQSS